MPKHFLHAMPGFITQSEMISFITERLNQFLELHTQHEKVEIAYEIFYYIFTNFQLFQHHFSSNIRFMHVVVDKCHEMIEEPFVIQHCPNLVDICSQVRIKVDQVIFDTMEAIG